MDLIFVITKESFAIIDPLPRCVNVVFSVIDYWPALAAKPYGTATYLCSIYAKKAWLSHLLHCP